LRALISWIDRNAAVLMILIIAFALRIYGNGYGLPDQFNIDEVHIVSHAIKFGSGDLNPHFFFYPAFYMYVMFACYGAYFAAAHALGVFKSAAEFGMQYFIDPTMFYLIARTVTAAAGAATVYIAYAIGARFYNKRVGTAAAVLLCAAPLHVDMSHYAVTDTPMTFLIMLSLYFAMLTAQGGGRRNYLAAGVFGGLAMATKYTALLLVPSLIVAHIMNVLRAKEENVRIGYINVDITLMSIIFAAAFIAGAPYTILDFKTFLGDIGIQRQLLENGWFGMENVRNMWVYSIAVYLRQGMGAPLLAVALAGIVFAALKRNKAGLILLTFVIAFYLFHGRITKHVFIRYWVAVVPSLCVFAAAFIDWAAGRAKIPEKMAPAAVLIVAVSLVISPVKGLISAETIMHNKDTRTLALEWVEDSIAPGTRIASEFGGPQLKATEESLMDRTRAARMAKYHVDAAIPFYAYKNRKPVKSEVESAKKFHRAALAKINKKYDVFQAFALAEYPVEEYKNEGFEYLIVNEGIYGRYFAAAKNYPEAVAFYRSLNKDALLIKEFPAEPGLRTGPEVKIYKLVPEDK
jgi:4-amino-4-deoxy-L-arabinose transferase-like glycosyltransferase